MHTDVLVLTDATYLPTCLGESHRQQVLWEGNYILAFGNIRELLWPFCT